MASKVSRALFVIKTIAVQICFIKPTLGYGGEVWDKFILGIIKRVK